MNHLCLPDTRSIAGIQHYQIQKAAANEACSTLLLISSIAHARDDRNFLKARSISRCVHADEELGGSENRARMERNSFNREQKKAESWASKRVSAK